MLLLDAGKVMGCDMIQIRCKESCLEHVDRWLGTSAHSSQIKALKAYFESYTKTVLQRAYATYTNCLALAASRWLTSV